MLTKAVIAALIVVAGFSGAAAAGRSLPAPDGEYAVGMRRFELTDAKHHGVLSNDPQEIRVLPGYVWYPANKSVRGTRPYLTPAEAAIQGPSMARNFDYDETELKDLDQVIAHSVEDAPPASGPAFPILIFSHGYECYPAQNTALLERLASHGYIVVSIAHPHDSIDLQLSNGTVLKTEHPVARNPEYAALRRTLASGPNHDARTAAIAGYAEAFSKDSLGSSLAAWRDDTVFTARAIVERDVPANLMPVIKRGDVRRLGFIGMSFGGATSAATCRLVPQCRVVINLDGGNYDPTLFNASIDRPMLLMMSDWVNLPLPGRPNDPSFHLNDYAYEPWLRAGLDPDVVRVRLEGIRHMGYTDLILLMRGANHEAQFGTISPDVAVEAIGAASLAFLNQHLNGGDRGRLDAILKSSSVLRLHSPASVREWARARGMSQRQ
jgi:predicted dienelactone hydrolase